MKKFGKLRKKLQAYLLAPSRFLASQKSALRRQWSRISESIALWWKSRNSTLFLTGLPGIVVLVAFLVVYLTARAESYDKAKIMSRYKAAAERAVKEQRFEEAKLYFERLVQFPNVEHEVLFEYAKVSQKVGDFPKMAAALRTLSPDYDAVFAPAHLWQATQLLSLQNYTEADVELARTHLLHAAKLRPDDVNANRLLGEIYFSRKDFKASLPYLQKILRVNPGHNLMAAMVCIELGDPVLARRYATDGLSHFREQCSKSPKDVTARLKAAECCIILNQFKEATTFLIDGLAVEPSPELSRALAQTFALWSDSIGQSENPDSSLQFELLSSGVKANPDEPMLFERILKILLAGGNTGNSAREFLLENVAAGRATGLSHLLLGAYAHASGENDEAKKHLQIAFDSMEQADVAANNLAWLLWQSEEEQNRKRALALIEPVIEKNPGEMRYLDTRGHVLMSLGQYREAIVDLEKYIAEFPENSFTHGTLAKCYDEIGLKDVADAHRRKLESLNRK